MAEEAAAGRPAMKPRVIGRYALFSEIAAGGMATVHLARLVGQVGFSRTVAIKRLHPQYAKDPEFVTMFLDEARLASRVQHPNVVTTLDVVSLPTEVFLVMEYVHGESLSRLVRHARALGEHIPPGHVVAIIAGMLHGLHAAHEAKSEKREPLHIVHRDVSPQNVLVGVDGTARVLDFGVAKAALRAQSTRDSQMKGKLGYMSPEQLNARPVDRRTDLFAAAVVLWEALTGHRLFDGADAGEIFAKVLASPIPEPASLVPGLPDALCRVVMKGLERNPADRYQTARDFAVELEGAVRPSTARALGEWVERVGGADLAARSELVAAVEATSTAPEDLAQFEAERAGAPSAPPAPIPRGGTSVTSVSSVTSGSGSRPRLPPPPAPVAARPPSGSAGRQDRPPAPLPPPPSIDDEPPPRLSRPMPPPSPPPSPLHPVRHEERSASTSQVSNLAVPKPALPPAPAAQTGVGGLAGTPMWIWGAALAAALIGGSAAYQLFALSPTPTVTSPVSPGAAPPVAAAAPVAPVALPAAVPSPPAERREAPRAVLPSELPREVVAENPPAEEPRPATRAKSRPKTATTPVPDCNPPFTLDSRGIKRLKPGCA